MFFLSFKIFNLQYALLYFLFFPSVKQNYPYIYRISYLWYVVIGFLLTLIIGTTISLITKKWYLKKLEEMDPDLFTPPVANYLKRQRQAKIKEMVCILQYGLNNI